LVEEAIPPPEHGHSALVRLSCIEVDAQGKSLELSLQIYRRGGFDNADVRHRRARSVLVALMGEAQWRGVIVSRAGFGVLRPNRGEALIVERKWAR
jgi:hypothetical protein